MSQFDAITVQPKDAQAFWADKVPMSAKEYGELDDESRSRGFFVSGLAKGDLLDEILKSLDKASAEGIPLEQWKRNLSNEIERKGWASFQPYRLENIYRTNMQSAYMAGRYQQMRKTTRLRPYWQIVAVNDSRTRPSHAAMHGLTYPADHEFWDTYYPPNGYRCRCTVKSLSKRQVEEQGVEVQTEAHSLVESKEFGLVNITPPVGFDRNVGKDWWAGVRDLADPKKHPEAYAEAKKHPPKEKQKSKIEAVSTNSQLAKQLEGICQEFVKEGTTVNVRHEFVNYLMGTDSKGQIIISTRTFDTPAGKMSPATDLFKAWNNIAKGSRLTWKQEYAIEGLWHEILHNRQIVGKTMTGVENVMMETINQWYSRRTYQQFMERIGRKPLHQADIKKNGVGYMQYVRNFDKLLKKIGIDEGKALQKVATMHGTCDRGDYINEFAEWVGKERESFSVSKVKDILKLLNSDEQYYEALLNHFVDD